MEITIRLSRTAGDCCSWFGRAQVCAPNAETASRTFLEKTYSLVKRRMCVSDAFWMMRLVRMDGSDRAPKCMRVCVCVCVCVIARS